MIPTLIYFYWEKETKLPLCFSLSYSHTQLLIIHFYSLKTTIQKYFWKGLKWAYCTNPSLLAGAVLLHVSALTPRGLGCQGVAGRPVASSCSSSSLSSPDSRLWLKGYGGCTSTFTVLSPSSPGKLSDGSVDLLWRQKHTTNESDALWGNISTQKQQILCGNILLSLTNINIKMVPSGW